MRVADERADCPRGKSSLRPSRVVACSTATENSAGPGPEVADNYHDDPDDQCKRPDGAADI